VMQGTDRAANGREFPAEIETLLERDVPLWAHTSLRIGGPARFYARPTNVDELHAALRWARDRGLSYVVLGRGSNVIFPDSGFSGLVVHTSGLRGRRVEGASLRAAAGERLADVAWPTTKLGLSGIEWACGIPGTIGGAVAMNAGADGGDIAAVLVSADVLTDEGVVTIPADSLGLGYRTSALLSGGLPGIVVEATFELRRDDPRACLDRARSSIERRLRRLPVGASAGCIFRNPDTGPPAGELLERAGCKGLRVGRAVVSARHANVIVNEGVENARDVLELIDRMKERVLDAFGVELREEVVVYP
jgi:UDP-N-acetylmuramate dehydrogenase